MIGPWLRAVLIVPTVECTYLLSPRVMLRLPHRVELLGGPRSVFNRVNDVPTIDNSFVVGLEKTVFVGIWRV